MSVAEIESDLVPANLAAFAQYMPDLFEKLRTHVPQTSLVRSHDGSYDVEFRGQRLYDTDGTGVSGRERAAQMMELYRGSYRDRISIKALDGATADVPTTEYLARLLKAGLAEGITFLERANTDEAYHLVVFGLGLGYHLEALIELVTPQSICIVEPNLDFLYHSLAVLDWRPILARRATWAPAVTIVLETTVEQMAYKARMHCRHANPTAVDGMLTVQCYANDVMAAAKSKLRADAHLIHMGLGFFYDEMEMVRASYFNLLGDDNFRMLRRSDAPIDVPAFIVGSGPSIDDDLDFLRANQDRAVIFSCGTALGVLLANGIRPDFQLILENGEEPRLAMEMVNKTYDFDGIILLGSNTISPQTRALFKESVYFMRPALSSYSMFTPGYDYTLDDPGPTVTNTGLSAALALGFRQIYLFGTDLGARAPDRHHSRFSPYKMTERKSAYADGAELEFNDKFPEKAIGNFGGVVFTNDILSWSRDGMESVIRRSGTGKHIANCSDGLRIKGARPQVSGGIKLTGRPGRKAEAVRRLMEWFPTASTFGFRQRWASVDWRGRVRRFADRLIEVCEDSPETSGEFLHRMCPLIIPDHTRLPTFEEYFLRGTVFISLIGLDFYIRRVHPAELRATFRQHAYEGFAEMIEHMVEMSGWFLDHLDEFANSTDLKEGLKEWAR